MSVIRLFPPQPGRPGPGPIPEALLRTLDLSVRRRLTGLLPGEHPSAATGAGTELALIRPYRPGDDVRHIDWNVTARTREPHVRERVAERVFTSWLMLDVSPSMTFGTADRRKWDVAQGVALVLAHPSTRRGNRLGVLTFGGRRVHYLPPRAGHAGLIGALHAARTEPTTDPVGSTSLGSALRLASRLARRGSLIAVVTDFRGPRDWAAAITELTARHDVLAVEVRDPREQAIAPVGHVWLVDPETDRQVVVDTSSSRLRQRFAAAAVAEREDVAAELRRAGARHAVVSTQGDWLRTLAALLRRRLV